MSNMIKSVRTYALDTSNPASPASTDTLAADVASSDTVLTLTGTGGITATQNGSFISINGDTMQIMSGGGTTSLTVARNATTAASHSIGDTVSLPGFTSFYLLPTTDVPNQDFYIYKATPDPNYVLVICEVGDSFRDGSTTKVLADASDGLGTLHIHAPGGSTVWIQTAGAGGGIGGGGGGGITPPTGGTAPPVTIDPVATVLFMRNNHKVEIDVVWRKAATATAQNFSGVAVYLEDPDISSGAQTPLDGTVVLDGSAQVSGNWVPAHETDSFVQSSGSNSGIAVIFPDSQTTYTQSRNVRIYLASFGPSSPPVPVRANQPGASPNIMVEIPIGPDQGQSGMEWAFLVDNVHVDVKTDYNRPDPKYYLVFTYDPPDPSVPVPPGVNRFGGVRIVYVYYDSTGNPVFPGTDTGIDVPVAQAEDGYKSDRYDASAGGGTFRVYFCSEDDASPVGMHVNSLVDGVTPFYDAVVPPIPANQIDVGNLTISNEKVSWLLDNTLVAQATFAWSLPDASISGNRYAGVRLYLVSVAKDTGNDGSIPLTAFPTPISDTQANVDVSYTVYETPPAKPEVWTVAAISVDANGGLADIPGDFGKPDFHSPTVLWHVGNLPAPGDAALVTVNAGASAVDTQTLSSDGVGMVSFQVGPWTNPTDATFGGVQVAMVVNHDPNSAIFWQVPNGATSFTTPPIPSFGNLNANVPVDFYLVSDDPQGKKNPLELGGGTTPKIGSTYVPKPGAIIPARSGWFSSEFSWPDGGSFQAVSFAAQKIFVGDQLVVGGAPSSFNGPNGHNGQIAVKRGDGTLVAWMGQSEPNQGQGQGPSGVYGGWFGQIYIGGTNPLDAPIYVDNQGIIEVGGIAPAQNNSTYPYISIRDATGLEMGRIGAKLTAPAPTGSSGNQGGVGSSPTAGNLAQLTAGAWFTQLAIGGSNLSNWNILITPSQSGNPLGSDFLMRNIRLLSVDYPQSVGSPNMNEYKLEFGNSVWMAGGLSGGWQFPGMHIYEVDGGGNNFGATFLNRGIVLRGHGSQVGGSYPQGYPVICSLTTWNGLQSGADGPPFTFWADLAMYSPTSPFYQTVYLSSGATNGSASFALRDFNGFTLFNVDGSGNTQVAGVLSGVPDRNTGAAKPISSFAYKVSGYTTGDGTVIDSTGKWVGQPITTGGSQTPWTKDITASGFALFGAGEIHGTTFWVGGASLGAGTPVINSSGSFVGIGVDVQNQAIYCGFLSTVAHGGGTGEIDCKTIKSQGNIICTQGAVDQSKITGLGWIAADTIAGQNSIGTNGQIFVNSQVVINGNGAFVSPGGIDVGTAGIGGGSATIRGRVNCQSLYAASGAGGDSGDIYFDSNVICFQGVGRVVIDSNRVFTGSAVNVGSGNVTCGSANIAGNMTCGSFTLQGLFSANQIAVQCSPVDAVTATLVGYGQFRAVYGNYGVFLRNDGSSCYFLVTNSGDPYGAWSTLRPLHFALNTGEVVMEHGVGVGGYLNVGGLLTAYNNIVTQASGVVSAGNFNIVGGQPGAGTLVDGSRNVFLNQLYCDWWSHTQPVINQGGQFVGAGINVGLYGIGGGGLEVNSGPVNGGIITARNYFNSGSGYYINGQLVINSNLQFTGAISTSQGIGCGSLDASFGPVNGGVISARNYFNAGGGPSGGYYVNGVQKCDGSGVWIGGVQNHDHVYGSDFGITGVAVGWPNGNYVQANSFATGDGRRCYVIGGIIVGVQ